MFTDSTEWFNVINCVKKKLKNAFMYLESDLAASLISCWLVLTSPLTEHKAETNEMKAGSKNCTASCRS